MSLPYRRCWHMDERGQQCETWFPAIDDNKLCAPHREGSGVGPRNGNGDEQKVRYIDLVNDEREYCYHFKDGKAEHQSKTLIFEFKDDQDGSTFEKLDAHLAFLDKVLEDVKARLGSARAVRAEKLDSLSEDQRKELRKIKVAKELSSPPDKKKPELNAAKATLWKDKLATIGANLDMDPEAMLAKFAAMKAKKSE